jgi:hypothetical protein
MIDVDAAGSGVDPIVAASHFSAGTSLFFAAAGALAFGALAAHALLAASRNRRMAASAVASFQPDRPYVAGELVVHGRVATAEGATRAVRVEVEQEGTESESSGVWSHAWTEVSRQVFVEPFYIVDAANRRTRVEPRDDVLLVDAMDGKILVNLTRRIRSAELTPGEEVWASGELTAAPDPEAATQGYRSSASLVLRAPPGRRMLLSSAPLGARFEAKERFYRRCSAVLGFVGMLAWAVVFGPYFVRGVAGETRMATVTQLRPYDTEDDDGHVTHHFSVGFTLPGASAGLTDDVSSEAFHRLQERQSIAVRWVPSIPRFTSIGPQATMGNAPLVVPFAFVWFAALLVYRNRIQRSLDWYEKKVVDKGKGKLADEA